MASASERAMARNPVCASGTRTPPTRDASAADSQLLQRRPRGIARPRPRAPSTRSASPLRTGTSRPGGDSARPGIRRGAPFEDGENRLELGAQVFDGLGRERASSLRLELARAAILLDLLAGALDGVLLRVEQVLHQHDQLDLAPLVHPVTGAVRCGVRER